MDSNWYFNIMGQRLNSHERQAEMTQSSWTQKKMPFGGKQKWPLWLLAVQETQPGLGNGVKCLKSFSALEHSPTWVEGTVGTLLERSWEVQRGLQPCWYMQEDGQCHVAYGRRKWSIDNGIRELLPDLRPSGQPYETKTITQITENGKEILATRQQQLKGKCCNTFFSKNNW